MYWIWCLFVFIAGVGFTNSQVCLLLKTMQYIVMMAHKKGLCDDICPMRCHYRPYYPHLYPGNKYGPGYGHVQNRPDVNIDIESLARAMGVPKDTFSDMFNTTYPIAQNPKPPKSNINKKSAKDIKGPTTEKDAIQFADIVEPNFYFGYNEDRCTTPSGGDGSCLNIRNCEPLLQMLLNMKSIPGALPYLRQSVCGYEGTDPIVCCPRETETPTQQSAYTLPTLEDNCGLSNGTFLKRVVNGVPAQLGAWPWVVVLGYKSRRTPGKTIWQCGGTLITKRHVLTAAHCIHGHEDDLDLVRLGELDLDRDDDGATPTDVVIEKKIKHEDYNPRQYSNDIGILKLAYDVTFTRLIWPICIPKAPELRAESFERKLPFIAGWGAISFQGPAASHLQQLQIPVVSNEECKQAYARFTNQVIDQRVLCAGYARGGQDACQGDSGGPLMWPQFPPGKDTIHYYLIGVVSYGFKCAEPGYPGVYTRVTEFVPWIESHLND